MWPLSFHNLKEPLTLARSKYLLLRVANVSEKEGTGSFQLVNYSKLQMQLSSDYNYDHVSCSGAFHNDHFSCLGDFNYPPGCTGIIPAGIRRPHVQEYLTKQSLKQSHFVFIMYLFDVGDQCVVNGAQ